MLVPLLVFAGLVVVGLVVWSVASQRRRSHAQTAAVEQLGFRPCPERKAWLEEMVARIANDRESRYEVTDSRRLAASSEIYFYIKRRDTNGEDHAFASEEVLFPLQRPTDAGLVLTVKPTTLSPGFATKMIGSVATGPWDTQPDDLSRLEVPLDLKDTNLIAAMGPSGARLYDLLGSGALGVMLGFGDAGALSVQCRGSWCSVSSMGGHIPFRVDELVARIRSLA